MALAQQYGCTKDAILAHTQVLDMPIFIIIVHNYATLQSDYSFQKAYYFISVSSPLLQPHAEYMYIYNMGRFQGCSLL